MIIPIITKKEPTKTFNPKFTLSTKALVIIPVIKAKDKYKL